MKILALDLGTKCGWCITDGTVYDSGVWDLSIGRFEGGGMRFLRFRQQLDEVLEMVDMVAYEEVRRHMGVDAAHVYGGLQAVLTEECERREIPYQSTPVGTLKKFATGQGNANKDMMLKAAQEAFPHMNIVSHDAADALHLARYAAAQMKGGA